MIFLFLSFLSFFSVSLALIFFLSFFFSRTLLSRPTRFINFIFYHEPFFTRQAYPIHAFSYSLLLSWCSVQNQKARKITLSPVLAAVRAGFRIRQQCKSLLNRICVSPGKTTFKLLSYYLAKHCEMVFMTIDDDFKSHSHKNNGAHVTVISPL